MKYWGIVIEKGELSLPYCWALADDEMAYIDAEIYGVKLLVIKKEISQTGGGMVERVMRYAFDRI